MRAHRTTGIAHWRARRAATDGDPQPTTEEPPGDHVMEPHRRRGCLEPGGAAGSFDLVDRVWGGSIFEVQPSVEVVDDHGDRCVAPDHRRRGRHQIDWVVAVGASANEFVAVDPVRCSGELGHEPIDEPGDRVTGVVGAVGIEEPRLGRGQLETRGGRQAEVVASSRWSPGGPATEGVQRPSAVNGGQGWVTGRRAKSLVSGTFARVGSVGLARIEPATSTLSGPVAVATSALVSVTVAR
jgi:hypothetical protein